MQSEGQCRGCKVLPPHSPAPCLGLANRAEATWSVGSYILSRFHPELAPRDNATGVSIRDPSEVTNKKTLRFEIFLFSSKTMGIRPFQASVAMTLTGQTAAQLWLLRPRLVFSVGATHPREPVDTFRRVNEVQDDHRHAGPEIPPTFTQPGALRRGKSSSLRCCFRWFYNPLGQTRNDVRLRFMSQLFDFNQSRGGGYCENPARDHEAHRRRYRNNGNGLVRRGRPIRARTREEISVG